MPAFDAQLLFSDGQVVDANGNSTNTLVTNAPADIGNSGSGSPNLDVRITDKSGTDPTLRVTLVGADDADFLTGKITISDTGTVTDPPVGQLGVPLPHHEGKKYFRLEYEVGGVDPSFTVIAGIC